MEAPTSRPVTRAQIDAAFMALGRLEGIAGRPRTPRDLDPRSLGDAIAVVLHAAAHDLARRERRSRRAPRRPPADGVRAA